ncbi:MAG: hypothetical protein KKF00_04265 [Proteobacteria bacterium]|nr:hypothetical protein [Pseudomonadota bacterium]
MEKIKMDKPHAGEGKTCFFSFMNASQCGAKTRKGHPCKSPAMKNGRCRMHGGKSTGPKTPEGIERIRAAHLTHGNYTQQAAADKREFRELMKLLNENMKEVEGLIQNTKISI